MSLVLQSSASNAHLFHILPFTILGCSSAVLKANLQIEEQSLKYNLTKIFNPLMFDVISLVVGHLGEDSIDLHEVVKVENKTLGLAKMEEVFCHIGPLDAGIQPSWFILETAAMEAKTVTVDLRR